MDLVHGNLSLIGGKTASHLHQLGKNQALATSRLEKVLVGVVLDAGLFLFSLLVFNFQGISDQVDTFHLFKQRAAKEVEKKGYCLMTNTLCH